MSDGNKVSTNPLVGQHAGANPLKTDPELKRYLAELPDITSKRQFDRWRGCFLTRYELFLGQGGTGEAAPAYQEFCKALKKLDTIVQRVKEDLAQDKLSVTHASVGARTRLTETQKHLNVTCQQLQALTPATLELEQELGYTKFQLGAMLVRDGFAEYHKLADCDEACGEFIDSTLKDIADRQLLEQMHEYQTKFAIFCDIMADLGLYEAMLKCHELNQLPPEPESEDEKSSSSEEEEADDDESLEPPKSPSKWKKDEEDDKSKINPYAFKMSFPALKPPSGPFIKYVDTGAKTQDDVVKGVVPRGQLSSSEFQYNHGGAGQNSQTSLGGIGHDSYGSNLSNGNNDDEEDCYKPSAKMEFKMNMDYHGGTDTESWRIKDGVVPNAQNKKMTTVKKKSSNSKTKQKPAVVDSDSGSSSDSDNASTSSSSSEESNESIQRKREAAKQAKAKKKRSSASKAKQ